jgi:hypothetical protein
LSFGSPLIAAEGYFFCLDTKEAKDQVIRKASLRSWPYAHNPAKPGLETYCGQAAQGRHTANISYALQPHNPPLFCSISAEAVLLTVCLRRLLSICHSNLSVILSDSEGSYTPCM